MDFSTKAQAEKSALIAEEINKQIEAKEIKNLLGIENGIRERMKEIGSQVYSKVLES